jgi:two-component system chemotaxis sensor kinase CheA
VLGVIEDITEEEMLRRQVEKERAQQEMILRALVERNSYFALLNEAEELFHEIHRVIGGEKIEPESNECANLIRNVHTFKANAGFLYMYATAEAAHHFETALEEAMFLEDSEPVDEVSSKLQRAFNTEVEIISNALGHGWMNQQEIHEVEIEAVERALWLAKQNHPDDTELIETLDEMARLPLASLFNRYIHIAPQLAERRGKMVRVQIEHNEIAVHREIYTSLNDSLNHMIRNIIDHGIEAPSYREQAGKDPHGEIRLAARMEGEELIVHVGDDGDGIDYDKIRERAEELGWIEPGSQLSRKETTQLLFRDGFSMAMAKTATSGRGVGLSAVRKRIKEMGGSIVLSTRRQGGTEFKLKLPMVAAGAVARESR